jgi:ABC-type glycerol-3-phosphate transport system substrate-binding protein
MSTMQRSRREFLKGAGAAAGMAAGAALFPRRAYPQTRTLTIWHTEPANITVKAVQAVCDRFEQLHPGVKVVQEGMSTSTVGVKLLPSLAAGNPPDIAGIAPFFYRSLQKKGQLVPIDDVIMAIGKDDIVDHVRDMALYKGHYWGIPHMVGVPCLIIRKDFAEQAGFKVPDDVTKPMFKSWAEQVECLRAMTQPEKRQWGMSLPGTGYYFQEHAGRWVSSNGGGFYDRNWSPMPPRCSPSWPCGTITCLPGSF